jgi:hypothetical protein
MRTVLLFGLTLLHIGTTELIAQHPTPTVSRVDPVSAILDAFRTNDIVTLTDPHGNQQVQQFLLTLVRDRRLADHVNDIVLETLSARYQDVVDRYVRGDSVDRSLLRRAWEDHTVVNNLGAHTEEVLAAIREANAALPSPRRMRVLAGDPPIDWDNVGSGQEHRRWIELRDSYPADVVRRNVLDRGRKALLVYGQGHLLRQQIATNYDMSAWQAQTVVSLLQRDHHARIFNVWTLLRAADLPVTLDSSRAPSLFVLRGTALGVIDFAAYDRGLNGSRVGVKDGKLVQVPREEWKALEMQSQFDALLYLGPVSAMTTASVPTALCQDTVFVRRRVDRLTRFGPPPELQRFKQACGL